jgi:hypothetical protein
MLVSPCIKNPRLEVLIQSFASTIIQLWLVFLAAADKSADDKQHMNSHSMVSKKEVNEKVIQ